MRVEAYAIAHANWIRRYGLPTNADVALLRSCYFLPTTTAAEWAVISARFSAAIAERKASPLSELRQTHPAGSSCALNRAGVPGIEVMIEAERAAS